MERSHEATAGSSEPDPRTGGLVARLPGLDLVLAAESLGDIVEAVQHRMLAAGIDLVHIPYKGAAPALTDLIGGQISIMFAGGPSAANQIKAGRLKLLAVASPDRVAAFPAVPTMIEAGLSGFDARAWWCVVAPANTPAGIVTRLNHEINRALALPDVRERFASQGADAVIMTPTQLSGYFKSEVAKWAQVVVASGARAE